MQYDSIMKTVVIPQVRIEPELRFALESVLRDGETISEFVEASMRSAVEFRRVQASFQERGETAWKQYQRTGEHVSPDVVLGALKRKLDAKRKQLRG